MFGRSGAMADRIILHCDLNNFFASVSLLSNPTLYDLPVAVCGSKEERHGIVLAKNERAKSCGVKTAEAIWEAKSKCPDLIILPPDYKVYRHYSEETRKILLRYTDLVEPFGIDESWLDVTGSTLLFGDGETIANRIRRDVRSELGLTVSVGVSFNKIFAKLGSDMKKPDAVTVISRENYRDKVWRLPVENLLFVGKSTAYRLHSCGIFTIGDITECDSAVLHRLLGKNGDQLKKYALGEDNSPVTPPSGDDVPKSIGRSVTPPYDITCPEQVWEIYLELAEDIASKLRRHGLFAGGLQVHTRTLSLVTKEYSRTLAVPLNTSMSIARRGMELFKESCGWESPLRSVGLRAINLKDGSCAVQQDMFGDNARDEKDEVIESSMENLRERFGKGSIRRGRNLNGRETEER